MAQDVDLRDRHRIVAGCMIYKRVWWDWRVLVIKRHPTLKVYPGLWTVPAGGMDRDDYAVLPKTSPTGWINPLDASLRREIKEESGLEVGKFEYVNHYTFIRPDDVPVFGIHFAAPYISGDVVLDSEDATEYAWISDEDVPNYELLGTIGEDIKNLDARLRSRQ